MLQPAPAFSSTAGKGAGSTTGGGSSRNSRVMLPTTTDPSPYGSQQTPSETIRPKLAPLPLSGAEKPPSYQECIRTTSMKRPSLRAVCATNSQGDDGRRLRRQSSDPRDRDDCMRKRSVSFPENVQALAEHFVSLGLSKDGRTLLGRDANGNVTVASSLTSSALQTPKGKSPACSRNCTPDRSRPSLTSNANGSLVSRPCQCGDSEPLRRVPSGKQNGKAGKWEEFETQNGNPPALTNGSDSKS